MQPEMTVIYDIVFFFFRNKENINLIFSPFLPSHPVVSISFLWR